MRNKFDEGLAMLDKAYKLSIVVVNAIFIGVFLALMAGHLAFADRFEQARLIRELTAENKALRERAAERDRKPAPAPSNDGSPTNRGGDWRTNGVIDDPRKRTGEVEK